MLSFSSRLISRITLGPKIAADDVAAQRQRQAGLLLPPDAQIDDQLQSLILKRQLSFVDDQAGVEFARLDRVENLVERHHLVREAARAAAAASVRKAVVMRPRARRFCALASVVERHRLAGHHHRAIAIAHAAAARQQGVFVEQMGVGMDADGGDFQLAPRPGD